MEYTDVEQKGETYTEIMTLIAQLAEKNGWLPIGWRQFQIGEWDVTVNGTRAERDHIPPYHAMIAHKEIVAFMLVSPFAGTVGGWQGAEDDFINEIRKEIAK